MRNTKKRLFALLLVVLTLLCQVTAGALDLNQKGSLELTIQNEKGDGVKNVKVALYRVGTVRTENNNLYFDVVEALDETELDGLNAQQNQETAALLLETVKELDEGAITAYEGMTDTDGKVRFETLEMGVYLVAQTNWRVNYLEFAPFLAYLPATSADGTEWETAIKAVPKVEYRPSGGDPEEPEVIPDPEVPTDPGEPGEPEIVIPEPDVPTTLPQTGMLMWPIPLMAMAGLVLFAAGWSLEKKAKKS